MAVRVADPERELVERRTRGTGDRHEAGVGSSKAGQERGSLAGDDPHLPVEDVATSLIGGIGAAVPRGEVLQELDARPSCSADLRDAQPCTEHAVQLLLLRAV